MPQTSEWKIMLVAVAGTFMNILDQTIMNIALPHIMAVYNVAADHAQLVISAYMMATAISIPSAAYLCDRFGIKKIYILSQVGFLSGSILCGLSWDVNSLIVFRILQGIAGGLLLPTAMTILFLNVPPDDRGTAMGLFGISMMLAPAIGPTFGGYLVDYWSWRMCFYVNVPVVLVAILMSFSWLEEAPSNPAKFDFKGFALAAIGFSSLLYAFSYAPSWDWDDPRIIGLLALGTISLLVWVVTALRSQQPMLDLHVFRNRAFSLSIGLNFITTIGLYSTMFLLPLFLQNVRGLTAMRTGIMLLPQAFGSMISMPISGRLYDKIGPKVPAIVGLIITGITTLWMQRVDITTPDDLLRWMLFFRGLGMGFAMMPIMTYALSSVPQSMTAQASSILNVIRTVIASLGIAIFATMLSNFEKTNIAVISQTLTPDSVVAMRVISIVQATLMQAGQTSEAARQAAISLLYQYANLRAVVDAFAKDFVISAVVIFFGVLAAFLLPFGRVEKSNATPDIPMG